MPEDRHVRRSAEDYAEGFANLLPQGRAWPRDPESVLMKFLAGEARIWGDQVDARAADLLEIEADPRLTNEMLSDWETAFGLPDPCVAEPLGIEARHAALINRMTTEGGQSRAFFIAVAAAIGYAITITEYSPFMCGMSRCGDTRPTGATGEKYRWEVGSPDMRFYWTVRVSGVRVTWFRAGSGQCGVDPMVRIALATDLECVFRRWKPAHTQVIFDYSNSEPIWNEYVPFRVSEHECGIDPLLRIIQHGLIPDTP